MPRPLTDYQKETCATIQDPDSVSGILREGTIMLTYLE